MKPGATHRFPSQAAGGDPAGFRPLVVLATPGVITLAAAALLGQGFRREMLAPALMYACGAVVSLYVIAASADALAGLDLSGIVYAISTATTVVMFCLVSRFILRERFGPIKWAGVALGVAGIVLMST